MSQQNSHLTSSVKVTVSLFLAFILVGMVCLEACRRKGSDQVAPVSNAQPKSENLKYSDIAYAYHGLLLNSDLQEIKVDSAVLEKLQDSMIESLVTVPELTTVQATAKQQQVPKPALDKVYVDSVLTGFQLTDTERVLTKSALIKVGIDLAPRSERPEYQWRFDLINERTIYISPQTITNHRPEFENYLTTVNLREILAAILRSMTPSAEYMRRCEANEVPIPPDWPTGDWQNRGTLPFGYNFLCSGRDTEVWTYEDGQGVCYALPRKTDDAVNFLGMICQSKNTGKACFWDNIRSSTHCDARPLPADCRITGEDITLRISDLQGGSILAENCTDCHRGGNAFLIHPRTPLAAIPDPDRYPNAPLRYEPLGQSTWVNPPAYSAIGDGACASCHEIPDLSFSYCQVLRRATEITMPDDPRPETSIVPAQWITPLSHYAMHIDSFKRRCGTPALRCPLPSP